MRNLVVCCDGTWQDMVDKSNVLRLREALDPSVEAEYVPGVGTADLWNRLRGGVTGWGLSTAILEGYRFLVGTYRPEDHISLFGFSRGAYTARSLAGMIAGVGIADGAGLDERQREAAVRQAFRRYQELRAERKAAGGDTRGRARAAVAPRTADGELRLAYDPRASDIPVVYVGAAVPVYWTVRAPPAAAGCCCDHVDRGTLG